MKNDTSLFSLRNIKILTNMQKKFFEILVQIALTVGLFWTILKLTPKSALLSFTILYEKPKKLAKTSLTDRANVKILECDYVYFVWWTKKLTLVIQEPGFTGAITVKLILHEIAYNSISKIALLTKLFNGFQCRTAK